MRRSADYLESLYWSCYGVVDSNNERILPLVDVEEFKVLPSCEVEKIESKLNEFNKIRHAK